MIALISPSIPFNKASLRMNVRCMRANRGRGVNREGVSSLSSIGTNACEEAGREVGCKEKEGEGGEGGGEGASLGR